MRTWLATLFAITLILALASAIPSCGGGSTLAGSGGGILVADPPPATASGWPSALPVDHAQPWEALDRAGLVIPRGPSMHAASSINAATEFVPGVERDSKGGDVVDFGEASRLASGSAGGEHGSHATYRIPLGAAQPGTVALDVNLNPVGGGTDRSAYYVGLSDYTRGTWEWHGPFDDSHVRLSPAAKARAGTDYTSTLGSVFICVVAWDGAAFDVVGVGVNPLDAGDTTAPAKPAGLTAAPVAGGLSLTWNAGVATDLAGYRIYWKQGLFVNPTEPGVGDVGYLEGLERHVLPLPTTAPYTVRIAAVDLNGNASAVSDQVTASPLAATGAPLNVSVDQVSIARGGVVHITATGADSYDFDLDGDGSYETPSVSGTEVVDTSAPGLIRPHVRGTGGGSYEALGGVSLIVLGNTRPVASAIAVPDHGVVPLTVQLTGTAQDLEDAPGALTYAWDYTGDGTYESGTDTLTPLPKYTAPGLFNVKFRVTDSQGAWDVDTVTVLVEPKQGVDTTVVAGDTSDVCSAIVYGDRLAIAYQDSTTKEVRFVRATRADATTFGAPVTAAVAGDFLSSISLQLVDGFPAIAYATLMGGALSYVRASNAQGTAWGSAVLVDGPGGSGQYSELVIAAGNPAIGYYNSIATRPYFCRAINAIGSLWAAPVPVDVAGNGSACSTAIVDGKPAMAYSNNGAGQTWYCRATNVDGSLWGAPVSIAGFNPSDATDLQVIGGAPCLAYGGTAAGLMYYTRAYDAQGTAWWPSQIAVRRSAGSMIPTQFTLADISGALAVAVLDKSLTLNTLWYCEATDITGLHWNWPMVIAPYTLGDGVEGKPALVDLDGNAGLVYIYNPGGLGPLQVVVTRKYRN